MYQSVHTTPRVNLTTVEPIIHIVRKQHNRTNGTEQAYLTVATVQDNMVDTVGTVPMLQH